MGRRQYKTFDMDFTMCKGPFRHSFEPYIPLKSEVAPRILACPNQIYAWCTRCTTARHWGLDLQGNVIKVDYIHPDGYHESADDRLSTQEMRLIVIKRGPKGRKFT